VKKKQRQPRCDKGIPKKSVVSISIGENLKWEGKKQDSADVMTGFTFSFAEYFWYNIRLMRMMVNAVVHSEDSIANLCKCYFLRGSFTKLGKAR
jgi:hypothetical protein